MESRQGHLPLIDPDPQTRWLGPECAIHQSGDLIVVLVGGTPLFRFEAGSAPDTRLAAAVLANSKAASVQAILDGFGLDDATLWRARQRLEKEGVAGLLKRKTGPKKPFKLLAPVVRRISALRREKKLSARAIAVELRLSHTAVLAALHAAGELSEDSLADAHDTPPLPFARENAPFASGEEQLQPPADGPARFDTTPAEAPAPPVAPAAVSPATAVVLEAPRELPDAASPLGPAPSSSVRPPLPASKRAPTPEAAVLYAQLGLTYDGEAEVVFQAQDGLPFAGVLLAIPALVQTGLLDAARQVYGGLRAGVYGLRATMLVLAAIALLRRPRPEHLKGTDPSTLGDVLGLLRVPEVKTIRRKLAEFARAKKAHRLMEECARRWLADAKDADELGTLYIDGHVRDYHGKHKLPKTHISQRNLCAPATTDYWLNGVDGDPIFVVTAKANAAMTQVLLDVIKKAEEFAGGRKGTIVFDRGGWSPDLFKKILDEKWHILTYRKGKIRKHPRGGFKEYRQVIDGKERQYTLSERNVRLTNGMKLREIAELRDDGGQTIVLTSHFDKSLVLLAYRMFERWRQENFFRYMKENFALDALVDYDVEPDDPAREVPNPAWNALDKKLKAARANVAKLEREYGAAAAKNVEAKRPTMRGFKIANGDIGQALRAARADAEDLESRRALVAKRVTVAERLGVDDVVKLSTERKLLTDIVKAACYRAETALLRLLESSFSRAEDEGRAFLRDLMELRADLRVDGDDVTVRFRWMSAPRFTAALRALCAAVNAHKPTFPETTYRLHFEVAAEAAK